MMTAGQAGIGPDDIIGHKQQAVRGFRPGPPIRPKKVDSSGQGVALARAN
jgi:hypothetical protein